MKVEIDISKSLEENAAAYYERAKKLKAKIKGVEKIIEEAKRKLKNLEAKKSIQKKKAEPKKEERKKEWYEKFRWFFSSGGFLCIGGRDATTNDIIIKKYAEDGDLIFHTDIIGSPFFVIRGEGKKIDEETIKEAAQATASYSRAWREGFGTTEVYCIGPEQVKKELGLPKGTFMIHGQRKYFKPELIVAIGFTDKIIGGPPSAIIKKTDKYVLLKPGDKKTAEIVLFIKKVVGGSADEIQGFIPAGGCAISKSCQLPNQ